ncbi:uncharacterized protein [Sinocyclocheilus grahami]|uniref:uncharacterized protein n=1 Tax=Sinocyclocheilus grahami TaxID=75366 RepID=UPI0007AD01A4|nr:PREDICTED: uncharacterized protein LOC107560190 [Sinocyclocheilus grahami]
MSDECHLCLLGLIVLSSLLTGISGVDDAHVFISSGEDVRLLCNNALHDCKSTTWNYNRFRDSAAVELIGLGIKKNNTERHERLSLGSNCSLNINNISKEDYGSYTCQQWTGVNRDQKQGTDAHVYLHVLHAQADSTAAVTSTQVIVIAVCASFALLLPALILWLMSRRKRAAVRRATDDSVEQTDDVTYTEVTAYSKNRAKKKKVRCDDKVTYASIGGATAGAQENCSQLYASVNKNHHKSGK